MARYEVTTQVNSYAWVIVEAESQEEAETLAKRIDLERWRLDTDYSTAEEYRVEEVQQ